jgi:hypothetical protein
VPELEELALETCATAQPLDASAAAEADERYVGAFGCLEVPRQQEGLALGAVQRERWQHEEHSDPDESHRRPGWFAGRGHRLGRR